MSFLANWFDRARAKRAAKAAYRSKYPDRADSVMVFCSDHREFIFVSPYLDGGRASMSWWLVGRLNFEAIEIDPPANWREGK